MFVSWMDCGPNSSGMLSSETPNRSASLRQSPNESLAALTPRIQSLTVSLRTPSASAISCWVIPLIAISGTNGDCEVFTIIC